MEMDFGGFCCCSVPGDWIGDSGDGGEEVIFVYVWFKRRLN